MDIEKKENGHKKTETMLARINRLREAARQFNEKTGHSVGWSDIAQAEAGDGLVWVDDTAYNIEGESAQACSKRFES